MSTTKTILTRIQLDRYADQHDHTPEWPASLPFPKDVSGHERRFDMKHARGFHGPIVSITGLAIGEAVGGVVIYGDRTMHAPKESGYVLQGRVSVDGKSRKAFTGSKLFTHNGKLYNFAVLHVVKG